MNSQLIIIALILAILGCNKPVAHTGPTEPVDLPVVTSPESEAHNPIDFDQILLQIKNCNEKELAYFYRHWDEIRDTLKHADDDGTLANLPISEQEELWDELSYLHGCRHGNIMREHGKEMVSILFKFGTDEQCALLRDIYPDYEQNTR